MPKINYVEELARAKSLLVELSLDNPTPDSLNIQSQLVHNNFNTITAMRVDAAQNRANARGALRSAKLNHSVYTSRAYRTPEVKSAGSSDLRKEECNLQTQQWATEVLMAEREYDDAEAFYDCCEMVFKNLEQAQDIIRDQRWIMNSTLRSLRDGV